MPGRDTLSCVDLTAVAAFVAAALSLISVIIGAVLTFRLTNRGQVEQWRREQERPIVARILTISDDMMANWSMLVATKERSAGGGDDEVRAAEARTADSQLAAGQELHGKLRYESAQLDLLAGPQVRDTAHDLAAAHSRIALHIDDDPAPGTIYKEGAKRVFELTELLVEQARADLGL
jgi:hypothetical protein